MSCVVGLVWHKFQHPKWTGLFVAGSLHHEESIYYFFAGQIQVLV